MQKKENCPLITYAVYIVSRDKRHASLNFNYFKKDRYLKHFVSTEILKEWRYFLSVHYYEYVKIFVKYNFIILHYIISYYNFIL